MQTSHLVEPALVHHSMETVDVGAQTIESRRPVKDFYDRDRHPPGTAASPVRSTGSNNRTKNNASRAGARSRQLTPLGQSQYADFSRSVNNNSRASDRLSKTLPLQIANTSYTSGPGSRSQTPGVVGGKKNQSQQLLLPSKKNFSTFCSDRGINILPLAKVQRDTFVTHYDRQELGVVESNEAEHRSDIFEAMIYEYTEHFTFLSRALWDMHLDHVETRAQHVLWESTLRNEIESAEQNSRIPISHERCKAEYSYKYLEQIMKRGAILEDDMKRERKLTGREEDQRRKFILSNFRVMRAALEKKEASNIQHMNIQASCFAKAAANFHLVCHESDMNKSRSRAGGRPNTTADDFGGGSDPMHPTFSPIRAHNSTSGGTTGIMDQSDIDSNHHWMTSQDIVSTVISPLSPLAGTAKHTLRKTQFIQEVLATRPALYTKKRYGGPEEAKKGTKQKRSSSGGSNTGRFPAGKRGSSTKSAQRGDLDTHSLAPTIPYWLYKVQTMQDFQRALYDRLDTAQPEYLPLPQTTIPLLQQLPLIDDPWQRLNLVYDELRFREEEDEELVPGTRRPVTEELEMLELNLTAAALLCKLEDPRRSIMLVSECLMKLESLIHQPPPSSSGNGKKSRADALAELEALQQHEGLLFKLSCVSFYNGSMSLAMLPEEHTGGAGSSTAGSETDRRKSRVGVVSSNTRRGSSNRRWHGMDDTGSKRINPVELAKMAAEVSAVSFGPHSPFAKHLQQEGVANVLQMDVLPQSILPPATPQQGDFRTMTPAPTTSHSERW